MKASIITIGDEILIGQVIDTNSAWIGAQLEDQGYQIRDILSVSDERTEILAALERASSRVDLVIVTGGLGPTKDDITKQVMAEYFDCSMVFNQKMYDMIAEYFRSRDREITELHRQQCYLPERAKLLKNALGTAPGMLFEQDGVRYISMPGVPYEMKYIMSHGVIPLLDSDSGLATFLYKKTIRTAGEGESIISERIQPIIDQFPDYIKIAYLPSIAQVRLRVSGSHADKELLKSKVEHFVSLIIAVLGALVFGYDKTSLSEAIGQICIEKKKKIATAESCTGGRIAGEIVRIPGSSAYFNGGVVSYSNEMKRDLLGVSAADLANPGAVSETVVEQMVKGVIKHAKADVAVAISGIAGPGGGTELKPVGTVWIAVGDGQNVVTKRHQLRRDRERNIDHSVFLALNMLRLFLRAEHI